MLPLAYTNVLYALLFWWAYLIWMALEIVGGIRQRAPKEATVQDHGSMLILISALYAGLLVGFALPGLFLGATIDWNRPLLFFIGLILMVLGVILRQYAILILGNSFTRQVATRPNQRVVQRGPYRLIRHPSYSGTLLTLLGIGLALTNWASILALVVGFCIGYLYRIAIEERALCTALGQPYKEYMRHTKRLIPFLF